MQEDTSSFYVVCEENGQFKNQDLSANAMINVATDENETDSTNLSNPLWCTNDNFKERQRVEVSASKTLVEGATFGKWITSCSSSMICGGRQNYDVQKWFTEKQNRPNLATIEMAL